MLHRRTLEPSRRRRRPTSAPACGRRAKPCSRRFEAAPPGGSGLPMLHRRTLEPSRRRRRPTSAPACGRRAKPCSRRFEAASPGGSGLPMLHRRTFAAPILGFALSELPALRHPWLRWSATPAPGAWAAPPCNRCVNGNDARYRSCRGRRRWSARGGWGLPVPCRRTFAAALLAFAHSEAAALRPPGFVGRLGRLHWHGQPLPGNFFGRLKESR